MNYYRSNADLAIHYFCVFQTIDFRPESLINIETYFIKIVQNFADIVEGTLHNIPTAVVNSVVKPLDHGFIYFLQQTSSMISPCC